METIQERVDEVWRTGRELGLRDSDIEEVFLAVLEEAKEKERQNETNKEPEKPNNETWRVVRVLGKGFLVLVSLVIIGYVVITLHNPTRKFVTRNIQDAIYPFMTSLRVASLPLLSLFPQMSHWYSEECLLKNPFYDQPDVDCVPCMTSVEPVRVSKLKNFTEFYYNNGKIVVVTDAFSPEEEVSCVSLMRQFDICKEEEIGSLKLLPKSEGQCNILAQGSLPARDSHIEWKVYNLETLHILRKFLPRMYFIPQDTEVALHRHIFIDRADCNPYHLPLTEFANVVIVQGEGMSVFNLEPSPHCRQACQPVSVELNTTEVLFFNWMFWRAVRLKGSNISTVFMSSFY